MNKKIWQFIILFAALGLTVSSYAQYKIKGRVIDEDGKPLVYAHVVLLSPADSTLQYFDVADEEGYYNITNIKPRQYLMQYSFVTKEVIYENVVIPSAAGEDFGDKVMKASMLGEVLVTADYVPMQIKQDTVVFNAKAFKTKTGAVVEDLLKKIPGIEVDNTGNVKALGEDVTKVLVDGKEFFDSDPKVATKNLPAKAIDKVEVYDKQTEDAEFTGIYDGVLDRTINLLLNKENKRGYFGNVEAGIGTGEHYKADGKLYRFSSRLQSAFLGMLNNVNQFGYTGKGHGEWGKQISGLNTTAAGGINLSLNTKKPNRYFISYLASTTKTILEENTTTENFIQDGSYFLYEDLNRDSRDTPHNINIGVRHNFSKNHKLTFDGNSNINSEQEESHLLAETEADNDTINQFDNITNISTNLIDVSLLSSDIIKLNKDNTQVKTRSSLSYNKSISGLDWTNTTLFYNPDSINVDNQFQDNVNERLRFSLAPTLIQKIAKFWYINAGLGLGSDDRTLDKKQGIFGQNDIFTDSLSADFNTVETFVAPSLMLQRSSGKSQFSFGVNTRWIWFDKTLDHASLGQTEYFYFLPNISYTNAYRTGRRINIRYSTSANMPGLKQLLPVTNTLNQLSLYQGNINLKPEYRHSLFINWSLFDHFSFTSLFASLGGFYTRNKVSMSQTINKDFTKMVTPVNVPDDYFAFWYINFSTPIRFLGAKISATSQETWNRGISVINSENNIQTTFSHRIELSIENRRKQKFHIRVGGSVTINDTKYSIVENMNNVYYNTGYYADIWFNPTEALNFNAEADIVNYNAQSFKESVSIPVISAGISYHFLRGKKASISLEGHDLLNKYSSFQRTSGVNYLMEKTKNVIGRYVMLTLKLRTGKV